MWSARPAHAFNSRSLGKISTTTSTSSVKERPKRIYPRKFVAIKRTLDPVALRASIPASDSHQEHNVQTQHCFIKSSRLAGHDCSAHQFKRNSHCAGNFGERRSSSAAQFLAWRAGRLPVAGALPRTSASSCSCGTRLVGGWQEHLRHAECNAQAPAGPGVGKGPQEQPLLLAA